MAISYSDLFRDIGKLIKYYNVFAGTAQGLSTYVDAIETAFATDHMEGSIAGLRPTVETAWNAQYETRRDTLAGYAANRITDVPTVASILGVTTVSTLTILPRLIEQFPADSQTINASTTSLGSVTANSGNVGNGTVLVTKLLDRVSSPGSRAGVLFPAHHLYGDVSTELTCLETMTVRCISDSFADTGITDGQEAFSWIGGLTDTTNGVQTYEGSGSINTIHGIHANTSRYLLNADFETFTVTNTPDSWVIVTGAVTTNIKKSTSTNAYHGTNGLNFLGDGATAAININQPITVNQVTAGARYCVTCRLKADATIGAGDLTIQFEGTGYSAGAAEKISIAHGALPTSWTLESFFVLMPVSIPSDFKLTVKWTGTPTNAKNIYLDDFGMDAVNYGGGLGVIVVRGATPFTRDDRYTFTVTPTEGVIQKFFRRVFGVQLPSDNAAGETILDSVAS